MNNLVALHNQLLCKGYLNKEASKFCGKLASIVLYAKLNVLEANEFICKVLSSLTLGRVYDNNYSTILELCPVFKTCMRDDYYGPRNISFVDFYSIVMEIQL